MTIRRTSSEDGAEAVGSCAQALEVTGTTRRLRKYREENRDIRQEMLKGHTIAMTVVLAGMFEDGWLLEIDAIAEK